LAKRVVALFQALLDGNRVGMAKRAMVDQMSEDGKMMRVLN
jgi:hypothetical protein